MTYHFTTQYDYGSIVQMNDSDDQYLVIFHEIDEDAIFIVSGAAHAWKW